MNQPPDASGRILPWVAKSCQASGPLAPHRESAVSVGWVPGGRQATRTSRQTCRYPPPPLVEYDVARIGPTCSAAATAAPVSPATNQGTPQHERNEFVLGVGRVVG